MKVSRQGHSQAFVFHDLKIDPSCAAVNRSGGTPTRRHERLIFSIVRNVGNNRQEQAVEGACDLRKQTFKKLIDNHDNGDVKISKQKGGNL
jgi:hypothetical protein